LATGIGLPNRKHPGDYYACSQLTETKGQATLDDDDGTIRPNEHRVDLEPANDASLRFIGTIRTPWKAREDCPRQAKVDGPECHLIVDTVWQEAQATLFYDFSLEDHVPQDHLLRSIYRFVDLSCIQAHLASST
jgi:hypothetical protein